MLRLWRTAGRTTRECPLATGGLSLVVVHLNILRRWWRVAGGGLTCLAQKIEACFDVNVVRVEVCCTLVCIQSIACLVVARFVQSAKIIPDFRDVRVEADGS